MSYRFRIERDDAVNFPPYCIECGREAPDSDVLIFSWMSASHVIHRHRHRAPACAGCAERIRLTQRLERAWSVIGLSVMIVAVALVGQFGRRHGVFLSDTRVLVALAVLAAAIFIPMWVWQARHPLPVWARGAKRGELLHINRIMLEFRDNQYALDFALLNHVQV